MAVVAPILASDLRPSDPFVRALGSESLRLGVVIPCYRVTRHVLDVLASIGPEVDVIYAVDDACPDGSGALIAERCTDPRVRVIRLPENRGVGGAVVTGYRQALADGVSVVVKVDGDGQMPPALIPMIAGQVLGGEADYAKGNRFFSLYDVRQMPRVRLFGNAVLSFMTKLSTGYWSCFDPTNGFTAIHIEALRRIDLDKLSRRYFFESDLLLHLSGIRAVVRDIPMEAVYADEESNLKISKILGTFLRGHLRGTAKRLIYGYFLRDFNAGSLELLAGTLMLLFGVGFGGYHWLASYRTGAFSSAGTVSMATLSIILGVQFLLAFLSTDISREPRIPIQQLVRTHPRRSSRAPT